MVACILLEEFLERRIHLRIVSLLHKKKYKLFTERWNTNSQNVESR